MIHQLSEWLAATPASHLIQSTFWLVPVVQTLHLLAISVVVASAGVLSLRLLGVGRQAQSLAATAQRFLPWIWGAVGVLLASGVLLIVGEPARTLGNPAFWGKLAALALALGLTGVLQRGLRRAPLGWEDAAAARWLGAGSLLLWVAVVVLGRWIAYVLEV